MASSLVLQNLATSEILFFSILYNFSLVLFSALYQIAHLGDDDGEPEYSSAMQLEEGETFFFAPRPLKNLVLVDELESLSPIMACQVMIFFPSYVY